MFLTSRPVYVSTSSATGLMEAAVRNVPRGRILSLVNGAFSERFADIASACGHAVTRITASPGQTSDLDAAETALRKDAYAAVTVAHSETSGCIALLNGAEYAALSVDGLAFTATGCLLLKSQRPLR